MRFVWVLSAVLWMAGCGGNAPVVTSQQVAETLAALGATNVRSESFPANSPVPKSFQEHHAFSIPSLSDGRGGQFFICDTKQNCDAIFAYFDAMKGLAGPYLYRSPAGTVVVQLNSGLSPDEANRYAQAIQSLP